jgi:hypothetical protein
MLTVCFIINSSVDGMITRNFSNSLVELYSTYVYQIIIKVTGIEKKRDYRSVLMAYVQILEAENHRVYSYDKPIMEGKLSESTPEGDTITLKTYFTSTSYQLNKMRFKLRLSLFLKYVNNSELQAPLQSSYFLPSGPLIGNSPHMPPSAFSVASVIPEPQPKSSFGLSTLVEEINPSTNTSNGKKSTEGDTSFVLDHDGFDRKSGIIFLACIISPEFFIYSKKNHTKESQKNAKIKNQKAKQMLKQSTEGTDTTAEEDESSMDYEIEPTSH